MTTRARTATATATATKPRSDLWRGERHENKARETAYVTRALSDYFGAACKDRGYSVTWKPISFAPGATDTTHKRVILSSGLLAGLSAPFTGAKVDELTGIAAHEAGHAIITDAFGQRESTQWQYDPLSALCRNLIEDMAIDAEPMRRHNGELGALTSGVRRAMRDEQAKMIQGYWVSAPGPAPAIELARIWGCARLFDCRDTIAARAGRELDTSTIALLDPIADTIMGARMKITDKRFRLVLDRATRQMIELLTGHEANAIAQRQADADKRQADADKAQADSDRADKPGESDRNSGERGERGDDQGIDDPDIDGTASDEADEAESESDADSDEHDSSESGKRERREDADTSDSEPEADAEADADANTDTESGDSGDSESESAPGTAGDNGNKSEADAPASGENADSDAPGDSESGDSDSDADTDGSESGDSSGSGGTGAGAAGQDDPEWTGQLPTICINAEAEADDSTDEPGDDSNDPAFWRDVQREAIMLDAKRPAALGSRDALRTLAPYVDRKIIGQIVRSYSALASEPTRRTRTDSGKIDRRRLVYADGRSDVFAQHVDRALEGSLILLLDLSSSTVNQERLIKQAGASVYAALKPTPIRVWVYSYGDPNVVQLATPDKVVSFDTVKADGGTPTAQAFARARADVKPRGQSVIIHVTDGEPNNAVTAHAQMEAARVAGWKVINVLVGYARLSRALSDVSDSVVKLSSYRELPDMLADAIGQIVRAHKRTIS